MAEFKAFSRKRGSLKKRVTDFTKYVIDQINNYNDGTFSDESEIELETRLARFTSIINEYETIQESIDELVASDPTVKDNEDYREEFESAYYKAITKAKAFIKNISVVAVSPAPTSNASSAQFSINSQMSGVKLPAIELPKFNGNYDKWLEFRDAFDAMVHQSRAINDVQKFYYLKAFLEGDAAKLVASIQTTAGNYHAAWTRLCERYESKKLLVQSHISSLFNLNKITKESAPLLREMLDKTMLGLQSLRSIGVSVQDWDPILVFIIGSKFDIITAREWENYKIVGDLPTFDEMSKFIKERANMLEILKFSKINVNCGKSDSINKVANLNMKTKSFAAINLSCYYCQGEHTIYNCGEFLKLSIEKRISHVKASKLCFNCLGKGHDVKGCKSSACRTCKGKHNSLLHRTKVLDTEPRISQETTSVSAQSSCLSEPITKTLLSTAKVIVAGQNGSVSCRVLLDSGSQSNFITFATAKTLKLDIDPISIKVSGISGNKTNIQGRCKITIKSRDLTFTRTIQCLVIPEITDNLPQYKIDSSTWKMPKNLVLADPTFDLPSGIDILLGANEFWSLILMKRIELGVGKPTLQNTKLGWVIAGPMEEIVTSNAQCNFSKNLAAQEQLSKFWELEEIGERRVLSGDEQACELHFQENVKRDKTGRFIVSIPFKHSIELLGDSKIGALKRFSSLEKKLRINPQLREQYNTFMQEYKDLGHMSKIEHEGDSNSKGYYLPHHGVLNETSATTRLRVVFDGSFSSDSGYSINDLEHIGPEIQSDLFAILLRFRQHAIALSADISKMYRQILVDNDERSLQCIFWRDDLDKEISVYKLNTLTYGRRSASFLAKRCLKQLSLENSESTTSRLINEDFYMDDFLSGCEKEEEAILICKQVSEILMQGCFPLRKWLSNRPSVLKGLANCEDELKIMPIGENTNTKTLGLFWNATQDSLGFLVRAARDEHKTVVTKRVILSTISQIFDPLGLIGACTIKAKILLQLIWREKIDWDDPIPTCIASQWTELHHQLQILNNLKVPRNVLINDYIKLELHGFADASEKAYGACIYVKSTNRVGYTNVQLLCSKAKVAPLKFITMPRLELCAALILAKLKHKVTDSLRLNFDIIRLWSDSQICLAWINSKVETLKVFVANRVSQILECTTQSQWSYVPTDCNPADMVSRGIKPRELLNARLWWEGPEWLGTDSWPKQPVNVVKYLPEVRQVSMAFTAATTTPLISIDKFSNYNRLIRATSYCFRFIYNSSHTKNDRRKGDLEPYELNKSLMYLVRLAQAEMFQEELNELKNNRPVKSRSRIASLAPFLDDEGIMRVKGRLQNSGLEYRQRHQIILGAGHNLTTLVFRHEHSRLAHAGAQQILCSIRDKFWPLRGKAIAKGIVRQCTTCFHINPYNTIPQMGNLPKARVTQAYPFEISGVDYAGPFSIKNKVGRGAKVTKCYLALFICFATKAIHLEIVSDLTTDAFIAALRRFMARRGKPKEVNSDNATNFVGADNELRRVRLELESDQTKIQAALAIDGVKWRFIPPKSPHFGGLWEAGVRKTKFHLRRVMGNLLFTYEELHTICCQIEAILNSRPLTALTDNPNDLEPLTPSHFLIGRKLTTLPEPMLDSVPTGRLNNYQLIQRTIQQFWTRWQTEYLHQLQPRHKWRSEPATSIKVGDLVLLKEDNCPPLSWPLGRVVKVYPSVDDIVRVADIRTARGIFKRASTKLYPLPMEAEAAQE